MNKLVVFDLDGTLINSVYGIAQAVNRTRHDYALEPLSRELITTFVGDGAYKLMERSLADADKAVPLEEAVQKMTQHYADDPTYETRLYAGTAAGLAELKKDHWIVCIISNKPALVGQKIIKELNIAPWIDENIGGGMGYPLKPQPDALLYLMQKYHAAPGNTWVVGDNHTDIFLAANGGARSIFCTYGFGHKAASASSFDAASFAEAVEILQANQ